MGERAKRYNTGKTRYGLIPHEGLKLLADVYTEGAHKYTVYEDEDGNRIQGKDIPKDKVGNMRIVEDGANNWRKGQDWVDAMESVKRHIQAWDAGEDFDELGTYHLGNAAWGLMAILSFYKTHPDLDSRKQWFKRPLKNVYFDIDGVIASFEKHFLQWLQLPEDHPTDWDDYRFRDNFHKIADNEAFWLTMPRLVDPAVIDYPIAGYCTARPCSTEVVSKWLECNGFPKAEIVNVGAGGSKVDFLKSKDRPVMIDDSIKNFMELQSNGIACFLMTRPHNEKYDVGHWRCADVKDFINKVKQM